MRIMPGHTLNVLKHNRSPIRGYKSVDGKELVHVLRCGSYNGAKYIPKKRNIAERKPNVIYYPHFEAEDRATDSQYCTSTLYHGLTERLHLTIARTRFFSRCAIRNNMRKLLNRFSPTLND